MVPEPRSTGRARWRCRRRAAPSGKCLRRFHDRRHELRRLGDGVRPGRSPRLAAPCEQLLRRQPMPACDFRNHRARNERLFNHPGLVVC
jgi:hypothetical protein